jgi:hypothetical protein
MKRSGAAAVSVIPEEGSGPKILCGLTMIASIFLPGFSCFCICPETVICKNKFARTKRVHEKIQS